MTTLQEQIALDITEVFAVEGNTPLSVQAVYTAPGGTAEDAVTVLYSNVPLHGDPHGNYPVEDEEISIIGKTSDVSAWKIDGDVTINSVDYQVATYPYPTDGYWCVVMLRRPIRNKTKI